MIRTLTPLFLVAGMLTPFVLMGCAGGRRGEPTIDSSRPAVPDLATYLKEASWDQGTTLAFPEPDEFVMANGVRVMVVEMHEIPMVYARAQIRGGSIYDPPGKSGLAYLTGWVLTEGTESYPDRLIDQVMDRHGAYVSSVAYNESCISTLTCLSTDLEELFPYFAEILSRPAFEERNLEEARNYIIGDLGRMMDDPGQVCERRFRSQVFAGHPYVKQHMGTVEGLRNCSRGDVLDFYHAYYRPDHAVLVLVGDVNRAAVERLCAGSLGGWRSGGGELPPVGDPDPISGRRIEVVDMPTVQAQIMMGHIGINRTNPDRFDLEVLNAILGGGGLYTRLATEVRVKRGLTYDVFSFFARREFTGEFVVSTFTKVDTVSETIQVILDELRRIREEPVTAEELKDAKQGLIGRFPLSFEEYEGISQALVHNLFYHLPREDITHYPECIGGVTAARVMAAAQRYIHPDDLVITVVGPAASLVPQLEQFGPVRVVPPI